MKYDEKATVSIDASGAVLKCAKGADVKSCGFIAGADICAKCGAMPIEMKMVPVERYGRKLDIANAEDESSDPEILAMADEEDGENNMTTKPNKKKMPKIQADEDMVDNVDAADMAQEAGTKADMMDDEDLVDQGIDEDMEDAEGNIVPKKKKGLPAQAMPVGAKNPADMVDEDMVDAEDVPVDEEEIQKVMQMRKKRRMQTMGMKSDELDEDGYLCAIERKAYPGGMSVCDNCPGGCIAEKGLPGILEIEGMAEEMFDGEVIDSGYSADADMFVVDVQVKDGRAVELYVDGTTAEVRGWHQLEDSAIEQKSEVDELTFIDFMEAAEIAVKSIDGHVVAVEPDMFEGYDAYAVEIDAFDGKSYDVFVGLDGEVLGYDKYEPEEADDIEAEAAEIALKRAFPDETRQQLAESGMAMSDGSFPIKTESDLRNAIQAYGRAKDKEAAKKHIMKRAQSLGMEKLIPANWVAADSAPMEKKDNEENLDANFMKALVEFQLLEADTEIN